MFKTPMLLVVSLSAVAAGMFYTPAKKTQEIQYVAEVVITVPARKAHEPVVQKEQILPAMRLGNF